LFEGLAKFIIKRHKLIIIFWVIVFILALPSIRLVKDVIVYEESEVSPLSTSNQVSQQIIEEEFPRILPESNAIIVVQADNVRTSQMREFMIELENRTWSGNDSGRLKGVTDVLTIQSTYETRVLGPVIRKLAPELDEADDSVNTTAELLYEMPSQFYENYTALD
jgi:predicted RND superfamily exporter protein